ncbi:hypothetical protein [Desulfosediminicola ganghwensis]|uniref:hypothetical protein n=1 Tax=Desulfosediminicola ganghwensis TaxID=2569540 RepID=UPI001594BCEE|nr:hypothetical protein [Desulfosediminicola ganghwensis]
MAFFVLGMTGSAAAQEYYTDISVGASLLNLPETQFFKIQSDDWRQIRPVDYGDDDLGGIQFTGAFGYRRDTKLMGAKQLDFNLRGEITSVSTNDGGVRERTPDSPYRYGWVSISNQAGYGVPYNENTLVASIDRKATMSRLEATIGATYDLKKDWNATVFIGPSWRYLDLRNSFSGSISGSMPDFSHNCSLEEDVTTSYWGGVAGVSITGSYKENWSGSLIFSVSAYSSSTDYKAYYEDSSWGESYRQLEADESAYGADLKLTVDYKVSPGVTLGFYAVAQYLSSVPDVNYGGYPWMYPEDGVLDLEEADLYGFAGGLQFTIALY